MHAYMHVYVDILYGRSTSAEVVPSKVVANAQREGVLKRKKVHVNVLTDKCGNI